MTKWPHLEIPNIFNNYLIKYIHDFLKFQDAANGSCLIDILARNAKWPFDNDPMTILQWTMTQNDYIDPTNLFTFEIPDFGQTDHVICWFEVSVLSVLHDVL